MQPRKTTLEWFSTFLNWSHDRTSGWLTDARLQRNMQTHLTTNATPTLEFWVIYWHRQWQQSTAPLLPEAHLSAYLQETCYWSVQRLIPKQTSNQASSQLQLADAFQIAIAALPKLLKNFDSNQRPTLNAYANRAFGNVVRDHLRQRQEIDICSDWSLLLKTSRKRLLEALQQAGQDPKNCDRILLAWTCFEDLYLPTKTPGLRQLPAPDDATWTAIADRYNRLRQTHPATTPTQLSHDLLQTAKQIRTLLWPRVRGLNLPKGGELSGELQDDLPATSQDSLLSALILQEEINDRQQQQQQLQDFLKTTLTTLDPKQKELLKLYYHDRLKQQDIAHQLSIQQYTVSRQLTKTRETLLLKLIKWAQETWHISPTSTVVNEVSTLLEDWLQHHYHYLITPSPHHP